MKNLKKYLQFGAFYMLCIVGGSAFIVLASDTTSDISIGTWILSKAISFIVMIVCGFGVANLFNAGKLPKYVYEIVKED